MAKQRKSKKIEKKELINGISKATGVHASRIKTYSVKNRPNTFTVSTRRKKDYDKILDAIPINHGEQKIYAYRAHPFSARNAEEYTIRLQTVVVPASDEPPIHLKPYPWEQQNDNTHHTSATEEEHMNRQNKSYEKDEGKPCN